jgi:hypothetical protein
MSIKRISLVAIGLGFFFCTSPAGADEFFSTGYYAFRRLPNASQECISEEWGATMNNCAYPHDFTIYDLPTPDTGLVAQNWHITARDRDAGSAGAWGCTAVAVSPDQDVAAWGSYNSFLYQGEMTRSFPVNNVPNGWALRLICQVMPVHRGIQHLTWGPN